VAFQQDLAPCHASKKVKTFVKKQNVNVLEWPGNSPDHYPLENLLSIAKYLLQKLDCKTMTKLIEAIIQVWYQDPKIKESCKRLVESKPNTVKEVSKNKDGHNTFRNNVFVMFEVAQMKKFQIRCVLHFESVNMNTTVSVVSRMRLYQLGSQTQIAPSAK